MKKYLIFAVLSSSLLFSAAGADPAAGAPSASSSQTDPVQARKALNLQISELQKKGRHVETLPLRRQILALPLSDADRVTELERIASLCMHTIRDLESGKKYFHEMIVLLRKQAASEKLPDKIRTLERIGNIYQNQIREKDNAKKTYEEVIALSREAMKDPSVSEKEKLQHLSRIRNVSERAGLPLEDVSAELLAAWKKRLAECGGLPPAEWLKEADPVAAVRQLSSIPEEGYRLAASLADKLLVMPEAGKNEKSSIAGTMINAAYRFKDSAGILKYTKKQAELTSSGAWTLRLGELYFRQERNLAKAREIFASVRDGEQYDAKSRESAVLWLEMLSDD